MFLVAAVVLALAMACKGEAAASGPAPSDDTYFTLTVAPVSANVGAGGELVVVVTPKAGFKFNVEYPTSLKVTAAEAELVRYTKTSVRLGDPEVQATDAKGTLRLPFTATKAGTGQLTAKASFSVCTATKCHVFRDRTIEAAVEVR